MSHTRNKIIGTLAAALAVAALAPGAVVAQHDARPFERTVTELGQAVGEPGERGDGTADALYSRTPTELGQRVLASVVPRAETDGFDWGDALIGALAASGLMLMTLATAHTVARHRGPAAEPGT